MQSNYQPRIYQRRDRDVNHCQDPLVVVDSKLMQFRKLNGSITGQAR